MGLNMLTKEECLKALCRIQCRAKIDCNECECYDTKINPFKCVENTKESLIIRQLINEHFELKEKCSEQILEPYEEIYKEVDGRIYIIVNPHKKYGKQYGYDGRIVGHETVTYYCLSLCDYTKEDIIARFEEDIKRNTKVRGK